MTLIVGGRGQGKLAYVKTRWNVRDEEISTCLDEGRVIYGLAEIVRALQTAGKDPVSVVLEHADQHPDTIYICDEVGCGVVPVERGARDWREAVGRCCVALAARAELVERVFCGLPMVLKGKQG